SFSDSRTSVTNWKSGQAPRVLAMGPRRVHFSIAHIRLTPFSCGFAYALGDRGSSLSAKHTTAIVLPTLGMGGNLGHPRERCALPESSALLQSASVLRRSTASGASWQ